MSSSSSSSTLTINKYTRREVLELFLNEFQQDGVSFSAGSFKATLSVTVPGAELLNFFVLSPAAHIQTRIVADPRVVPKATGGVLSIQLITSKPSFVLEPYVIPKEEPKKVDETPKKCEPCCKCRFIGHSAGGLQEQAHATFHSVYQH